MKYFLLALAVALFGGARSYGESAELQAAATELSRSGGTVVLSAKISYEGTPAALAFSLKLPVGWSLITVGGSSAPQVVPEAGATDDLEFAYTTAPSERAAFSIVLRYPNDAATADLTGTVIIRADGQLRTLRTGVLRFTPVGVPH